MTEEINLADKIRFDDDMFGNNSENCGICFVVLTNPDKLDADEVTVGNFAYNRSTKVWDYEYGDGHTDNDFIRAYYKEPDSFIGWYSLDYDHDIETTKKQFLKEVKLCGLEALQLE